MSERPEHDTTQECRGCGRLGAAMDVHGQCEKCALLRAHASALALARDLEALAAELEEAKPSRGVLGVQVGETDVRRRLEPLIARLSGGAPVARRLPGLAERLRRATPSEGFLGIQLRENDIADEIAAIVSVVREEAREERARGERLERSLLFIG